MSCVVMQKYSATGISFPRNILLKIDAERGDIPRSRYLMKMLEKVLQTGISPQSPQSAETHKPNGGKSNGKVIKRFS